MAKYTKTYGNGTVKNELEFRGKTYDYTMVKQSNGATAGDKPCFAAQLEDFDREFMHNDVDLDALDSDFEYEIADAINILNEIE